VHKSNFSFHDKLD